MSGSEVPYHLRPNKYVDRQLFIDLLGRIDRVRPMKNYVYVSMAGKFLEDHRSLHMSFDVKKTYSLENNPNIVLRQDFNKPFETIECLCKDSSEFVDEFSTFASSFDEDTNFVIWMDYADAGKRLVQLQQFSKLIEHSQPFDIFRITLNASIATLGEGKIPEGFATIHEWRLSRLQSQLGKFAGTPTPEDMRQPNFPKVLAHSIGIAAKGGAQVSRRAVRPLAVFSYSDGTHTMVTSTCIVLDHNSAGDFMNNPAITEWPHLAAGWEDVSRIDVPDLSMKEKVHIDRILFTKADAEIQNSLSFQFAEGLAESIQKISQYRKHYRLYPHYVRIGH